MNDGNGIAATPLRITDRKIDVKALLRLEELALDLVVHDRPSVRFIHISEEGR